CDVSALCFASSPTRRLPIFGPPAGLENASANGYSMIERRGLRSAAGDKKMGSSLGPFFADTWSFRSADTQSLPVMSLAAATGSRSGEHTSELQSPDRIVCRL